MKAIDNGCFFSVRIYPDDVDGFNSNWPCSNIPSVSIWAQFSKRNGDLVDLEPPDLDDRGADGSALSALIQDGQNYAAEMLGLPEVCFRR